MKYESTRDKKQQISSAQAIMQGISPDGGLYVPREFPIISPEKIEAMASMDYTGIALEILSRYLEDYTREELRECIQAAYSAEKFEGGKTAPLRKLGDKQLVLELWHGPTYAFKDMALQLLPHLMVKAKDKTGQKQDILILVATSGDTGKAALEGFRDVAGTHVVVFYPEEGVSPAQKLQMLTQEGYNVHVVAVDGNFDDAQNGVKEIFTDHSYAGQLLNEGFQLSSANSINWGRLVPQIVYYFTAYAEMLREGNIKAGEKINVVVPTGNFGNILAAFYAMKMGLPIHRLICASNTNHVLTDFFREGEYDRNRVFHKTISPSMDILISSNLERLLYEITGRDDEKLRSWMNEMREKGSYRLDEEAGKTLDQYFWAGYADDEETMECIRQVYHQEQYVMDPHTAVAYKVYKDYIEAVQDDTPTVVVSTASPFKFSRDVVQALLGEATAGNQDDFALSQLLADTAGLDVPQALSKLHGKPIRHNKRCSRDTMREAVSQLLDVPV